MPLSQIQPAMRNAKLHDEALISGGIDEFGLGDLPLIDERTGRLVAGHGRLNDILARHQKGETPPDGIDVDPDTGEWLMPVIRGWSSRSDASAEAFALLLNRAPERGGWDEEQLAEVLRDLQQSDEAFLALTGFDEDEIEELLAETAGGDDDFGGGGKTDPDDIPGVPIKVITQPGDVWLLGDHRVLCGDATDAAAVEEMLAGDRADCMWTDPPYGVSYEGKTKAALTIKNDTEVGLADLLAGAFAVATIALAPGSPVYVAHPSGPIHEQFMRAFHTAGWAYRQGLVWAKDSMVLGHSDYHYQHEPIAYGFTSGGVGRRGRGGSGWYGDNAQVSVFEVAKPNRNDTHPTSKPVELIRRQLANSAPAGGLVYDPFGGSGSTLIACQVTGRRAVLVEIDPVYVDVICRRYQEHTGTLPVLKATGEAHDFTITPE